MVFPSRWCRFFVVFVEDWVWRLGMGKVVAKGCPGCLSKRVMNGSTNVETEESEKGVGRSSNLWYSDARTLTVENPGGGSHARHRPVSRIGQVFQQNVDPRKSSVSA
ncbi:hypothetical protein CVV65_13430 [Kyrpidia spormannii]|uniref:Uncharacterized protein n=1 Tax=Kyrpidia spormannii TaxID=2055160 RepID=A0A2K8NBG4_9BACL|nr:hypothetical protein CVV65_13430 [Kyrpidia spormannii]